ncbi:MAG: hypothetical protein ACOWWH_12700 [Eubacteriaceae bacterium]
MQKKTQSSLKEQQLSIYKSLDFIPMYNYYKANETGDLRYLIKLSDYEELPGVDTTFIEPFYNDMVMQVSQITIDNDRKSRILFDTEKQLAEKSADYDIIQLIIQQLYYDENNKEEFIKELANLGYRINEKRDFHQELIRIIKQSKRLLTDIEGLKSKIELLTKSSGKKQTIWDEVDGISTYIKQDIDIHKTTMKAWLTKKFRVMSEVSKKKKDGKR